VLDSVKLVPEGIFRHKIKKSTLWFWSDLLAEYSASKLTGTHFIDRLIPPLNSHLLAEINTY
jgi:hypothetical protein